jgi:hypothetical protein
MCEEQSQKDEADVINKICSVQYSFGHIIKMLKKGDIIEDPFPYSSCGKGGPVQNPE